MTNNQLTENSVNQLLNSVRLARDNAERDDNRVDHSFYYALTIALEELQERRKADSEPVAMLDVQSRRLDGNKFALVFSSAALKLPDDVYFLYRHAQSAPERDQVRSEHAEWSQATFGNVGPVGPLKHLCKEALEAAVEPGDLSEWADMQFLLWDAQRRAGITDEQITQAMIEKLAVNKQREWPEPKDGEPRLHIKAQPEPVVPLPDVVSVLLNHLEDVLPDDAFNLIDVKAWNAVSMLTCPDACRAAMLQAEPVTTANKLGNSPEQRGARCGTKGAPALDSPSKNAESRCGNSPAIPDGYVMVPKGSTEGMVIAGFESEPDEQ
ncbi:DUF550 domain-containing protein [Klebsiella aerogenes]